MRALIVILAMALPAAACAGGPRFLPPDDDEAPPSAYGAFLSARYAAQMRDIEASAAYYDAALDQAPGLDLIADRAFSSALLAGDFARADRLAPGTVRDGAPGGVASLYLMSAALAGSRVPALPQESYGPFGEMIAAMLEDWRLAARGRASAAAAAAGSHDLMMGAAGHLLVHQALILEAAGEYDRAEAAYRAADQTLSMRNFTTVLLGAFLERRGRRSEAGRIYERQLARSGQDGDPEVAAALERVRAGGRAPRFPAAPQAAARAVHGPAQLLMSHAPVEVPVLYMRMAQRLDPDFDRNTLAVADALRALGIDDAARTAYASVREGPFAERAAASAAWIDFDTGARQEAVDRARAMAGRTRTPAARELLANLLQASRECEAAEALYLSLVEEAEAAGDEPDWRHFYLAGSCRLSRAGWSEAEPLMMRALELAPDEASVLNDVGYSLIVEGQVEEGLAMVERAVAQEPDNAALLDSMGWGLFRAGEPEAAVDWLERASERAPDNPVINWHLGDAYAATGRVLEAGFQWRRALELGPDADLAALLARRLELGLEAGPVEAS
ncbi:tetratricopeptide repeat protein [Alkalicaulis satelles]|uniref:Tetratricopeptide repeat protein n=1 Tax=Alkalicaulis satelles TaxID=2609175 RepID=A0A5M6ZK71_9PROT|nr:tetratricopeptide repeat protein [Alkalicaulis satelles]KAA5805232.1 tetratricopeptide repeat protein [Alkalicaulis satelles]